jgi:hypothetical protein
MTGPDQDTLYGWPQIAEYLGRSVRTAQRWEVAFGLPVRRSVAADGSALVTGSRTEFEAWRLRLAGATLSDEEQTPPTMGVLGGAPVGPPSAVDTVEQHRLSHGARFEPVRRPRWRRGASTLAILFVIGVAVGVTLAVTQMPAPRYPTRFVVEGTEVLAFTDSNERAWAHPLTAPAQRPATINYTTPEEGDLDGDGSAEVAVSISYIPLRMAPPVSDAVMMFGRDGRLWWTVQPTHVRGLSMGDQEETSGPWRVRSVVFATTPPGRVWIAYSHDDPWRRGFVLEVTADGRQSLRYVQTGRISALMFWQVGSDGRLAIGGTDPTTGQASLAILSSDRTAAQWPSPPSLAIATPAPLGVRCDTCPKHPPDAYFLLPESELRRVVERPNAQVMRILSIGDRLRVETEDGAKVALLAWVDANLRATEVMRPSVYWTQHQLREAQGRIAHTPHECPDSLGPKTIRAWRPSSGWTDDPVVLRANLPDRPLAEKPSVARRP